MPRGDRLQALGGKELLNLLRRENHRHDPVLKYTGSFGADQQGSVPANRTAHAIPATARRRRPCRAGRRATRSRRQPRPCHRGEADLSNNSRWGPRRVSAVPGYGPLPRPSPHPPVTRVRGLHGAVGEAAAGLPVARSPLVSRGPRGQSDPLFRRTSAVRHRLVAVSDGTPPRWEALRGLSRFRFAAPIRCLMADRCAANLDARGQEVLSSRMATVAQSTWRPTTHPWSRVRSESAFHRAPGGYSALQRGGETACDLR